MSPNRDACSQLILLFVVMRRQQVLHREWLLAFRAVVISTQPTELKRTCGGATAASEQLWPDKYNSVLLVHGQNTVHGHTELQEKLEIQLKLKKKILGQLVKNIAVSAAET